MKILIAGASGFIGSELVRDLSKNHTISVLGRQLEKLEKQYSPDITKITWDDLSSHDATQYDLVINLCGSNIGAKRWSPTVKKELIESRTITNEKLTKWLIHGNAKPRFFCANAIGIYGAQDISIDSFDENSPLPNSSEDFLQQIGLDWQQSLQSAIDAGIPVTTLRFGIVLKQGEGMLKKLELPFRLGLGSILGTGQQVISWVHYKDLIQALNFLIEHPDITGPVNITAPFPVSQQIFARKLATTLNRPLLFTMPEWFIKAMFGEMGEYLLLKGQKVIPKRLTDLGFAFTYPDIESALKFEYQNNHKH